jgi:hypothetical protein
MLKSPLSTSHNLLGTRSGVHHRFKHDGWTSVRRATEKPDTATSRANNNSIKHREADAEHTTNAVIAQTPSFLALPLTVATTAAVAMAATCCRRDGYTELLLSEFYASRNDP